MRNIKYTVHQEGKYYVSRCLNVEVSSFSETIDEVINNLIEAVELYFEDNDNIEFLPVDIALVGEKTVNA